MSEQVAGGGDAESELIRRGERLNRLLSAIVASEALVLVGATVWLGFELVAETPDSIRSAIALTALTALVAVWVSATAIGLWRRAGWSRGSAITWQVMQAAVAFGASQGEHPVWWLSAALIVPAVAVVLLAVAKPVRAAYRVDELG